jgi:hypothetical protein
MSRSRQRGERDPVVQLDDVVVDDGMMRCLEVRRSRRDEHRTATCHQPGATGHVVRVRVRVDRPRDRQPEAVGQLLMSDRKPRRIDDRGAPVIEIDQIRRMTEALVDELMYPHHHPLLIKELLEYS